MNYSLLIVLAILASIAIGYKTKLNVGLIALVFAYAIGVFGMGNKPSDIMKMWPSTMFFVLVFVPMFYKFINRNGALEQLAMIIVHKFRKNVAVLPFVLFGCALLMAALGSGNDVTLSLLMPTAFMIALKVGMSPAIAIIAVSAGATTGNRFVISVGGSIARELISSLGYESEAYSWVLTIFICFVIYSILLLILAALATKSFKRKADAIEMEKPEPLNKDQKLTLKLILVTAILILIPLFGKFLFPNSAFFKYVGNKADISFIALLMVLVAVLLKVGSVKEIVKCVPWNTVIMVCGVGVLVSLGVKAGMVDTLANWINGNISTFLIPGVICLIAGFMSFFSSTNGVVLPTLYPLVPSIAEGSGLSPVVLFAAILMGAIATGISPFSTGGGLSLAACPDEETREPVTKILLVLPVFQLVCATLFAMVLPLFLH